VPLDLSWLEQVPILRRNIRVYYRHVWIPATGEPDPFHVLPFEGRWPTDWTLYTATEAVVVWAEYCRNHADDVEEADVTGGVGLDEPGLVALAGLEVPIGARSLYELDFAFERLVDLTSPWARECLENAGFDTGSFTLDGPSYGDCPELASNAFGLGWQAMIVPSAAWPASDGYCVPVFASGRGGLAAVRRAIVAARPTVAVAAATTYPAGSRPAWLG
jgi:hypothetical protein